MVVRGERRIRDTDKRQRNETKDGRCEEREEEEKRVERVERENILKERNQRNADNGKEAGTVYLYSVRRNDVPIGKYVPRPDHRVSVCQEILLPRLR